MWNTEDQKFVIFKFTDDLNQKQELVQTLFHSHDDGSCSSCKEYEVKVKAINFQKVQLGEKIKRINEYVQKTNDVSFSNFENY